MKFFEIVSGLWEESGFAHIIDNFMWDGAKTLIMIILSFALMYLAIAKKFEPLLMLPIAFGMLLANLPLANLASKYTQEALEQLEASGGTKGLIYFLYQGVELGIYPPLIFLGIGAMTDFGPLLSDPKSLLMGSGAQLGIFLTFLGACAIPFFSPQDAGAIAIIGGADGPTAIYTATKLSPDLLPAIAIAAYSYMALVPVIQPPIMKALTTKEERMVVMKQSREVSKREKIIFPILVTVLVSLLLPSAATLVGMLMFGNLVKESGVADRLAKAMSNELMNIVTIMLGVSVGATATADRFLNPQTLGILGLGIVAFSFGTAGGVLIGKLMYKVTGGKVNPLIGAAGVSAVPMAARVAHDVGRKENPNNYLLMHAMGPNVAGVIGSAIAAGILINVLG